MFKGRFLFFLFVTIFAAQANAKECTRPIERIFTGYTSTTSKIHIEHGDGFAASIVRLPYVNNDEKIVDRILSVLMAAHMAGRSVKFRYAQGDAVCRPQGVQPISAVWLL